MTYVNDVAGHYVLYNVYTVHFRNGFCFLVYVHILFH